MKRMIVAALALAVATPALAGSDAGIPYSLQMQKSAAEIQVDKPAFRVTGEQRPAVGDPSDAGRPFALGSNVAVKSVSAYAVGSDFIPAKGDPSEAGRPAVLQ